MTTTPPARAKVVAVMAVAGLVLLPAVTLSRAPATTGSALAVAGSSDADTTGWWTRSATTPGLDVASHGADTTAWATSTATTARVLDDPVSTRAWSPGREEASEGTTAPSASELLDGPQAGATVQPTTSLTSATTPWKTTQPATTLDDNTIVTCLRVDGASLGRKARELVVNGSFDAGTTGWRTNNAATQKLAVVSGSGGRSVRLTSTVTTSAVLNDAVNTVAAAKLGTTYRATVRVRTTTPNVAGALRIREVGASVVTHSTSFTLSNTSWTTVTLDLTTTRPGATLDLNVIAWSLPSTKSLQIDDVSLVVTGAATPTAPEPTPTTPPPPVPAPEPTPVAEPEPAPAPSPAPSPQPEPEPVPAPAPPVATDPTYRTGWVLTEDVDLSTSRGWTLENGTASNTASQDLPENVSFGPEGLRIVGEREVTPNGSPFSSGDAKGTGHPIPNYARVEVVGRGPAEAGLWPAVLWLRPLYGSDGEIDLMENFGGQPSVKATLHNEYGADHKMIHGQRRWTDLATPDPDGLHTYVMDKTPNRIQIWVDELLLLDAGPEDAPAGFNWERIFENPAQQWYPRATLQIGCGTTNPTCATGLPVDSFTQTDMLITDLRIYRPAS